MYYWNILSGLLVPFCYYYIMLLLFSLIELHLWLWLLFYRHVFDNNTRVTREHGYHGNIVSAQFNVDNRNSSPTFPRNRLPLLKILLTFTFSNSFENSLTTRRNNADSCQLPLFRAISIYLFLFSLSPSLLRDGSPRSTLSPTRDQTLDEERRREQASCLAPKSSTLGPVVAYGGC